MKRSSLFAGVILLSGVLFAGCTITFRIPGKAKQPTPTPKVERTSSGSDDSATSSSDVNDWSDIFGNELQGNSSSDSTTVSSSSEGTGTSSSSSGSSVSKNPDKITNSTGGELSSETKAMLARLDTDYSKVKWGVVYNISKDYPGVVASVTPCKEGEDYKLVVAITNLYDKELTIYGDLKARAVDDSEIGELTIYESHIGTGSTVINTIECDDKMPDGRVRWTDITIRTEDEKTYTPWEADWEMSGNPGDGMLTANVTLTAANNGKLGTGDITGLLLDDQGYVIAVGESYISEATDGGKKAEASLLFFGDASDLKKTKDLASFANPVNY